MRMLGTQDLSAFAMEKIADSDLLPLRLSFQSLLYSTTVSTAFLAYSSAVVVDLAEARIETSNAYMAVRTFLAIVE